MRRIWPVTVVLALVFAMAAAGCGASKASADTIVRSAAAKTQNAKTAKISMVVSTQSSGQNVDVTADGVMDMPKRIGELDMSLGQVLPGTIHMIITGDILYMKLPAALASQIPGSKPFVKVDLQQLSQQQGVNISALQQNPDATAQLDMLRGVSNDVHEVGKEQVRGVATTHYQATVDLKKAEGTLTNPDAKAAMQRSEQILGTSTFPIDVWVDAQGRTRRLNYQMDLSKVTVPNQGSGQKLNGQMKLSMELFDFGTPVNVTAPPADQTSDLSSLIGKKP